MKRTQLNQHFQDLVRRDSDYMLLVCACVCPRNAKEQEEMLQCILAQLIEVVEKWLRSKGEPMPQVYFRKVFRNMSKKYYRQQWEYRQRHVPMDVELEASQPDEEASLYARLDELIARLSERDRTVIELYLQSDDYRVFAEQLGVSISHARTIVHRIVQKLRKLKEMSDNE